MGKLLRIIGYLVGLLLVLIVGLSIALPLIVDPNDFKGRITGIVQDKTGRQLTLGGDIGFTVFPWLGLELADVQLSNAQGFGDSPFARVDTAKVRVKLLPLLRKQVEMDTATLEGLQLNLAKDKSGRTNWDDLTGAGTETAPEPTTGGPALPGGLAVGGIHLRDARIIWDDRAAGSRYVVDRLSLNTGAVRLEEPFDFDVSLQLQSADPEIRSDLKLSGELWIAASLQQFRVQGLKTGLDAQGKTLPGERVQGELRADAQMDLEKQVLDLTNLNLETLGVRMNGDFHASALLSDTPAYSGKLELQPFAPRDVMQALAQPVPETADAGVLQQAGGALELKGDTNQVRLDPFRLQLDDTLVTGVLGLRNFAAPAMQVDLRIDAIDLDRYLPPPGEEKPAAATPGTAAAALPVEILRDLNLSGKLQIGSLQVFGIRSSDVTMEVYANNGKLRVHPASATLYQGAYSGDVAVDVSGAQPSISVNEAVTNVQVGPLLKDVTGDDKLSGTANVKLQLNGVGKDVPAMQKTLNGDMAFSFTNGAVKGVNIARIIREAKARLEGKPVPAFREPNQTDFSEMSGTAKVTNGVIRNDDLSAKSPLLRVNGKGKANLVDETIDYLLTVNLVGTLQGQGGEGLENLKGVGIPIRVGGTFAKPTYRPDLEAALGEAVKSKVEEKIEKKIEEKLKGKVDDQLKEQLKEGLKGLF